MKSRCIGLSVLLPMVLAVVLNVELWMDVSGRCWANPKADGLGASWTLWYVAERLSSGEWLGSPTVLMAFPEGGRVWPMHPVQGVAVAPLTLLFGASMVANLLAWIQLGLAGGLMTAVLIRLGTTPVAAFLASPVLSLSPVLLSSIRNGNLEVSSVFWLPLGLLLTLRAEEHPTWRRRFGLGLGLALALIDSTYMGTATLIVVTTWLLCRRRWRLWLQSGTIAALLGGWVLLSAVSASVGSDALVRRSAEVVQKMRLRGGAVSLEQWFSPGLRLSESPSGGVGHYLIGATPGVLLIGLVLMWGFWRWKKTGISGGFSWWLIGGLGVLLAMGPVLIMGGDFVTLGHRTVPLPMILWDRLPPFFMLTELWRFSILLHLALAVGLARFFSDLIEKRRTGWCYVLAAVVLIESLSSGSGSQVWQSQALPERSVEALMEGRPTGAVLDIPLRQGRYPLFFQTQHGMPIGNSVAMASVPQFFSLLSAPGWTMESLSAEARSQGFRWLIIHDTEDLRTIQPLEAIVSDLEAAELIVARSQGLVLVDLHADGNWPKRPYTGRSAMDLSGDP